MVGNMKIRIHKCGTIVCYFNNNIGFAIFIGLKDISTPILGKLSYYSNNKKYWFDL